MNVRGTPLTLILPLLIAPVACSLLAESELAEKPLANAGGAAATGTGGNGNDGGGGGGAPPCSGTCSASEACCDGTCADLATSVEHCGTCGLACGAGERCCGAMGCAACCETPDCPTDHECIGNTCVLQCSGQTEPCGDVCATLDTNPQHCGACFKDCLAGHMCASGVCQPGWVPMSMTNALSPRQRAAAAWAGTKLFVWGGQNAQGALGDGALYDPKTDTWTTLSVTDAPEPRVDAVAVWTGERVLVWGGGPANGSTALNTGKLYDPATDTWSSVAIAPIGRRAPVAFFAGNRVLIWAGSSGGSPIAGGALYDPAMNKWSSMSTANAPNARTNTAWVWTSTEMLLFGGRPLGSGVTSEGFGYDPAMNKWRSLSTQNAPAARYDAFTVWMNGTMLVYGGRDLGGAAFDDAAIYDPMNDVWSAKTSNGRRSAPLGRTGVAGYVGTHAVLAGGLDNAQKLTNDGTTYDVMNASWTAIDPWPSMTDHEYGVAVWTGEEIILWSGLDNGTLISAGERYRP
ncbi:kelch repeat-containing protein [Polyangium sp. 6x1]|uniref:Kelch repeat-containing protein n=1 Tax=Polyangium sp. 6x1 TaxID=3042689 RepID=UPI002482D924|nr:kelch repeat-containing protein [Polyangium sp. 6x1]MDI1445610.1 kelch repeat-containing protein [Polyangium sp. 6x1]